MQHVISVIVFCSSAASLLLCERGHQLHAIVFHWAIQTHSITTAKGFSLEVWQTELNMIEFLNISEIEESDYFPEAKEIPVLFVGMWEHNYCLSWSKHNKEPFSQEMLQTSSGLKRTEMREAGKCPWWKSATLESSVRWRLPPPPPLQSSSHAANVLLMSWHLNLILMQLSNSYRKT